MISYNQHKRSRLIPTILELFPAEVAVYQPLFLFSGIVSRRQVGQNQDSTRLQRYRKKLLIKLVSNKK